jgi:hypothetical protein
LCFGNSFGYLSREETRAFVRHVLSALRPGARWVIDTGAVAEALLPQLTPERTLEAGGVTYSVCSRYDPVGGRLEQSSVLSRGAERQTSTLSQAIYTVRELHELLRQEGWTVLGAWGGFDERPFTLGDRRLLLLAQR